MSEAKVKKGKFIFLLLRIAVVAGGIIWGLYRVSTDQRWSSLIEKFRLMNVWVFAMALGIFIICQILMGFRWWLLLKTQSVFIDFWASVRLSFLGLFYNNFMPSSVGGDLVRAGFVTKHTSKRFEAVLSVFVDRIIGLLGTFVIAIFFYLLFLRGQGSVIASSNEEKGAFFKSVGEHKGIVFGVVIAVVVVFCGFLLHRRGRAGLQKAWGSICSFSKKTFKKLKNAIIIYCSRPLTILVVFGLTIFLQILTITGFWLLGRDMGITASIKYYYVFFTLSWVLGTIPVSIGGLVVVEGSLAWLFINFAGVDAEAAAALALCQRAVWMLASLPGAVIHLIGAHLPGDHIDGKMRLEDAKDFFVDYDQSIN